VQYAGITQLGVKIMMIMMANVADAIYMLYAKEHTEEDRDNLKPQRFVLTAMETSDGLVYAHEIEGEAFAFLHFSVLISSEELNESGVDLEDTNTFVGKVYTNLKNSDLSNFLP
jgi:hypothetical protein